MTLCMASLYVLSWPMESLGMETIQELSMLSIRFNIPQPAWLMSLKSPNSKLHKILSNLHKI